MKENGEWKTVSWDEAIEASVSILKDSNERTGPEQLGVLMSPSATSEEYFLAQRLARQLGSNNIDHRLREQDFSDDAVRPASPAFRMKIADIEHATRCCWWAAIRGRKRRSSVTGCARPGARAAQFRVINPLDWNFNFRDQPGCHRGAAEHGGRAGGTGRCGREMHGQTAPGSLRTALERRR